MAKKKCGIKKVSLLSIWFFSIKSNRLRTKRLIIHKSNHQASTVPPRKFCFLCLEMIEPWRVQALVVSTWSSITPVFHIHSNQNVSLELTTLAQHRHRCSKLRILWRSKICGNLSSFSCGLQQHSALIQRWITWSITFNPFQTFIHPTPTSFVISIADLW